MHGDMVRFIAFDLVLWLVLAGMVRVPLVIHVRRMDLDNPAADVSGLGIPGDVIADFEVFSHLILRRGTISPEAVRLCSARPSAL